MKRYLLALSLGPVQSLIGAARRTRDLWCGSWLLSEAARAAARALNAQQSGCLIFPALGDPNHSGPPCELAPQDQPEEEANVSNILRAVVDMPDAEAMRTLCRHAKEAAVGRLVELGEEAREDLGAELREDVWKAQIDDILEFYAAWVPLGDYGEASGQLGRALAARKATRDFAPSRPLATSGLRKSSLDGAFETVLPDWKNHQAPPQLRLSKNEQLDALGVMKRIAGVSEQFTAYSRVAAHPWIEDLDEEQQRRLREAYAPMVELKLATRVSGNNGTYGALPYDGQLLFSSRLEQELSEAAPGHEKDKLRDLQKCIHQIAQSTTAARPTTLGEPVPYAAILKADGDRMGKFLSEAGNVEQSRRISRALHDFASQVRPIVQEHRGHAIYAGGDDVLALVPLPRSIECAKALAEQFQKSLASVADELNVCESDRPTLSAGIGIGYFMEPLGALRERAERAEALAKGNGTDSPRNALAIILGIRSGGEHEVRVKWDDDAMGDLLALVQAFREDKLPSRVAYDVRGIDRRLAWLRGDDGEDAKGMIDAELRRLLDRARTSDGAKLDANRRERVERHVRRMGLAEAADSLIVARWLSARTASELGER